MPWTVFLKLRDRRALLPGRQRGHPHPHRAGEIPIANIYYLLCYAWDVLEEKDNACRCGRAGFHRPVDLFARVLVNGTRRLLRRGLDRGYLPREDEIPRRARQVARHSDVAPQPSPPRSHRLCWDELEYDTLPNRILKTTLQRLRDADELDRPHVPMYMTCFAGLPRSGESNFTPSTSGVSNSIATTASTPSCSTSASSSTSTGSPLSTVVRGASAIFSGTDCRRSLKEFVFNFFRHELPADWNVSAPISMAVCRPERGCDNTGAAHGDRCLSPRSGARDHPRHEILRAGAEGRRLRDAKLLSQICISSSPTCASGRVNPAGTSRRRPPLPAHHTRLRGRIHHTRPSYSRA